VTTENNCLLKGKKRIGLTHLGANKPERATAIYSCHGVFTDQFILRLISLEFRIKKANTIFAQFIINLALNFELRIGHRTIEDRHFWVNADSSGTKLIFSREKVI